MRVGLIKIHKDLYMDMIKSQKALAKAFFAQMLPLQIDWNWDYVEVIGVSDSFSEISEGEVTPEYTASITDLSNDEYIISFIRSNT